MTQTGGSIRKGRNRERTRGSQPLDSAPPVNTDDSEQALDHVPQPLGVRKPQRFRRTTKRGPFFRSARNRIGTAHPVTYGRRTSTKNSKSVMENGGGCHANFLKAVKFQSWSGFRGTCWEAIRSSPVKADSGGRRRSASSAERRTRSGLLFSWEMCARIRYWARESKPSASARNSLTA